MQRTRAQGTLRVLSSLERVQKMHVVRSSGALAAATLFFARRLRNLRSKAASRRKSSADKNLRR